MYIEIPKTRCLTLEKALQRIFDDNSDDEQNETDIVVISLETAEVRDEEDGNDNIINNDSDILPNDTVGKIEVLVKNKSEPAKNSAFYAKEKKMEHLKWIKKDMLNMSQTNNEKG